MPRIWKIWIVLNGVLIGCGQLQPVDSHEPVETQGSEITDEPTK